MKRGMAVRLIGPWDWIFLPALICVILLVVFSTPVHFGGWVLPEPVFPMVLAFTWPLIRPSTLAPLTLLALGLFCDMLWGGIMGLWTLSLMGTYGAVLISRMLISGQENHIIFTYFLGAILSVFILNTLFVTLDTGMVPRLFGVFEQILATLILWPLVRAILDRFDDVDVRFR